MEHKIQPLWCVDPCATCVTATHTTLINQLLDCTSSRSWIYLLSYKCACNASTSLSCWVLFSSRWPRSRRPLVRVWSCCSSFAFSLLLQKAGQLSTWWMAPGNRKIHGLFVPCFYALDWKLNIARTGNSTRTVCTGAVYMVVSADCPLIALWLLFLFWDPTVTMALDARLLVRLQLGPGCSFISSVVPLVPASASQVVYMCVMCPHVPTSHALILWHLPAVITNIQSRLLGYIYIFFYWDLGEERYRLLYFLIASVYRGFKFLIWR